MIDFKMPLVIQGFSFSFLSRRDIDIRDGCMAIKGFHKNFCNSADIFIDIHVLVVYITTALQLAI